MGGHRPPNARKPAPIDTGRPSKQLWCDPTCSTAATWVPGTSPAESSAHAAPVGWLERRPRPETRSARFRLASSKKTSRSHEVIKGGSQASCRRWRGGSPTTLPGPGFAIHHRHHTIHQCGADSGQEKLTRLRQARPLGQPRYRQGVAEATGSARRKEIVERCNRATGGELHQPSSAQTSGQNRHCRSKGPSMPTSPNSLRSLPVAAAVSASKDGASTACLPPKPVTNGTGQRKLVCCVNLTPWL